jgi:hypothetical protein
LISLEIFIAIRKNPKKTRETQVFKEGLAAKFFTKLSTENHPCEASVSVGGVARRPSSIISNV